MNLNESITAEIRDKARKLLDSEQVDCVIGYEASARDGARPKIREASEQTDVTSKRHEKALVGKLRK